MASRSSTRPSPAAPTRNWVHSPTTAVPTQTELPANASPLLDRIPVADCQDGVAAEVTTDQRGITRPQGTGCDVGSVEVVVVPVTPVTPVTPAAPITIAPAFTG